MKHIIYFLILSICTTSISLSQTRFVTKSGNKILGIVLRENASEIVLNSLNDEQITIPISSIVSRDTLYFGIKTKSGIGFAGTITSIYKEGFDFVSQDGLKMSIKYDGVDKYFFDDADLRKAMGSKINMYEQQAKPSSNIVAKIDGVSDEKVLSSYQNIGFAVGTPGTANIIYGYTTKKIGFQVSGGYWGDGTWGFQIGPGINLSLSENSENNLLIAYSHLNIDYKYYESVNILWDANFSGFHVQAGFGFGDGYFSSPQIMFQIGYAYRWGKQ